ncbi:hypothetical protein GVN18_27195 [Pseudomonas sp. ODNR1LW]|nr:hypothetical protein [Pseudomonas sp. ODNR1LW]
MAFSLLAASLLFGILGGMPLGESSEPTPEIFARLIGFQGLTLLMNLGQIILGLVLWAACMRSVLKGDRPDRFFFMRLGLDELRLAVVGLALFGGAYVVVVVLVLIGAAAGVILWQFNEVAAAIAGAIMVLALIAGVALAMARLSMIAPATLDLGRFAFVEGWRLGRGQVLRLLGLMVCTWLIYMAIYFVVAFIVVIGLFASGAFGVFAHIDTPASFADLLPSAGWMWGAAVALLIPGGFVYGAILTLLNAPLASAYRQLAGHSSSGSGDAIDAIV